MNRADRSAARRIIVCQVSARLSARNSAWQSRRAELAPAASTRGVSNSSTLRSVTAAAYLDRLPISVRTAAGWGDSCWEMERHGHEPVSYVGTWAEQRLVSIR